MNGPTHFALAALTICCAVFAGCRGEEPGGIVRGKVTYKAKPLDQGTVFFYPNGSGQASYGNVQKDGTFQLLNTHKTERIEPGNYVAVILAGNNQIAAMKEDPLYPVQPVVPFKFSSVTTSPLKYEVKLGENEFDINLDQQQ